MIMYTMVFNPPNAAIHYSSSYCDDLQPQNYFIATT